MAMIIQLYQKQSDTIYIKELSTTKESNIRYQIKLNDETSYYYIKLNFIKLTSAIQIAISISLKSDGYTKLIDSFTLSPKTEISTEYNRELIIPKAIMNSNDIYLNILSGDYNVQTNIQLCSTIYNILPKQSVDRIGIWGSPSQLVCVNGEKILLGRTGIYELNNPNIKINFVGFIPLKDRNFVLDYAYEELKNN